MNSNPKMIQYLENAIRRGAISLAALAMAASASAASITWTSAPATVSGQWGETLNTGLFDSSNVLYAENTGGSAQTFDGISFGAGTINFGAAWDGFHSWLDMPSKTATYNISSGPKTVTLGTGSLPALTIGNTYKVQVLVFDGRGDGLVIGSTVQMDGINQGIYANAVPGLYYGNGLLVTGSYTADATTQAFTVESFHGVNSIGGYLNALVLNAYTTTTTPTFSPPGGGYVSEQTVTLTSDSGSTIYYTTDGSDPTTSGTRSSGASPITGIIVPADTTETIKTYATKSGLADSAVASATYTTYSYATWTSLASGTWADTANWAGGVVPNAPEINVDFSTLTLTGNTAVTSVASATVGNLIFGDQGNTYAWGILDGTLTLDYGSNQPGITTLNTDVGIAATLAGTHGLFKDGPGTLTLSGSSSYTGTTTVYQGTLVVSSRSGDVPYTVNSDGTLKIGYSTDGDYANTNLKVYGAGVAATTGLYLNGGTNYNCNGQIQLLGAPTTVRQYGSGLAEIGTFDINGDGMSVSSDASGSVIDANIQMVSDGYGMTIHVEAGANTATGDLAINGPLNVGVLGFYKRGGGSLVLNGVAEADNAALRVQGGTVICGIADCIGTNATLEIGGGNTLDLNGFSQTVLNASLGGTLKMTLNKGGSPSSSVLTVADGNPLTYGGALVVSSVGGTLAGGDTFTLFSSSGGYAGGFASVSLPALTDGLTWDVSTLATNGSITVQEGGFSSWIGSFTGLSDITPGGDPDADGISNLMEYVISGDPRVSSVSKLPDQSRSGGNLIIHYKRSDNSKNDTTQYVEWSTDLSLSGWHQIPIPAATAGAVTVVENGSDPDDVTVAIPLTNAANGTLFARLQVSQP